MSGSILFILLLEIFRFLALGSGPLLNWDPSHFTKLNVVPMGTKTRSYPDNTTRTVPLGERGCTLSQVQVLVRHGTRNPNSGTLKSFRRLRNGPLKSFLKLSDMDYELANLSFADAGGLTDRGNEDMRLLATNLLLRYGYLLNLNSQESMRWQVESTNVSRTVASATAFMAQANLSLPLLVRPKRRDTVLRFFDNCPRFKWLNHGQNRMHKEYLSYINRNYEPVAKRLNSELATDAWTMDAVATALSWCAFQLALGSKSLGWCLLFTPAELQLYDRASDIEQWYTLGPGYSDSSCKECLHRFLAAPLVQSITGSFEQAQTLGLRVMFAHAETILPLLASLQINTRYSVGANATEQDWSRFTFKGGALSPFAGRVVFELYSCESSRSERLLRVLINDAIVRWPDGSDHISLEAFKNAYASVLEANFEDICAVKPTWHPLRRLAPLYGLSRVSGRVLDTFKDYFI